MDLQAAYAISGRRRMILKIAAAVCFAVACGLLTSSLLKQPKAAMSSYAILNSA